MSATLKTDDIVAKAAAAQALAKAKEMEAETAMLFERVRIDSKTVILARPGQAERFKQRLEADRKHYQ